MRFERLRRIRSESTSKLQTNTEASDNQSRSYETRYSFKNELIVNSDNQPLASEFLLSDNSYQAYCPNGFNQTAKATAKKIVTQQLQYLQRLSPETLPFQSVFLNLERHSLCDTELLSQIIEVSRHLAAKQRTLVIETTERRHCCECSALYRGLERLKCADVALAMDDYEVNGDFREQELLSGLYDYVKVDNPFFNWFEGGQSGRLTLAKIEKLQSQLDIKWVVEKVNSEFALERLKSVQFWGYQGFYFNALSSANPEYQIF